MQPSTKFGRAFQAFGIRLWMNVYGPRITRPRKQSQWILPSSPQGQRLGTLWALLVMPVMLLLILFSGWPLWRSVVAAFVICIAAMYIHLLALNLRLLGRKVSAKRSMQR